MNSPKPLHLIIAALCFVAFSALVVFGVIKNKNRRTYWFERLILRVRSPRHREPDEPFIPKTQWTGKKETKL